MFENANSQYAKKLEEKGNGSDPHKGLKDVLPGVKREITMQHVYRDP
jgi:hypothetical protein